MQYCYFFYSFSLQSLANTTIQDSIPKFDKETFQSSLKELSPKEFARLFSLKAAIGIAHIKNNMLPSEDLEAQFWGYYCLAKWENYKTNFEESITYT